MIKSNIMIENARIGFRNFGGKEGRFNPEGRRNFCVFLDTLVEVEPTFNGGEVVKDSNIGPGFYTMLGNVLAQDGWNVRWLQPRDSEDDPIPYLQVTVSYDNLPPKIIMITSGGKTILDEKSVSLLDWAEIKSVDLIIRPYNWEVNGKSGVKAYIKSMYVTIEEDEFERKYSNIPTEGITEELDGY